MKSTFLLPLAALGIALAGCAKPPAERLFAAAAFTKAQKDSSIPTDSGLFVREDSGQWKTFGPKIQSVNSATVDPSDQSRVFLACGNGVARTTDGGATWRLVTDWRMNEVTAVVIDPSNPMHVVAASCWGIWRSSDGGDSWQRADEQLPEKFCKAIVMDASQPGRLIAGTAGGLFVSPDRGERWERVHGVPEVNILRIRQGGDDPAIWLAATEGRGAWLSTDGARSWHPTAPAVAENNLYGVAIDPNDADRLAVGGWQTGVYVSADRGRTWTRRSAGLPSKNVFALAFDPDSNGALWVSVFEEGTVMSIDLGETWSAPTLYGALVNDLGFAPIPTVP